MAKTLELVDGVLTLDLDGSDYKVDTSGLNLSSALPVPLLAGTVLGNVRYDTRIVSMDLQVKGDDNAELETNIRILNDMLSFAERRQIIDEGTTKVELKYQLGDNDAQDISLRILSGSWIPDSTILNERTIATHFTARGRLSLLCEPFGRLANVVSTERILNPEDDNSAFGNPVNYIDLAGPFNSHLIFDSSSGDVTFPDVAAIQNQFDGGAEISAEVEIDSDGEGDAGVIVDKAAWIFRTVSEAAGAVKLQLFYDFDGAVDGRWTSTDTVCNIGEKYRVGFSYDNGAVGNNPTLYVYRKATRTLTTLTIGDGLTETTTPIGTRVTDVGSDFLIGNNSGDSATFDGKIDDVRWYGTTGNVATEDMDAELVGDETNLIHYWPMDEGVGSGVNDKITGSTVTGSLTGATWGIDTHISGDAIAPLRVKVSEDGAYGSTGNIWLWTRSGERRADVLWDSTPDSVTEEEDPTQADGAAFTSGTTGGLTTNAHKAASAFMRWTKTSTTIDLETGVVRVGYYTFTQSGGALPQGLFRVLARVSLEHDAANLPGIDADEVDLFGFGLGYSFGGKTVIPADADAVYFAAGDSEDEWHILDLGELSIPPQGIPEAEFTPADLDIRIHAFYDGKGDTNQIGNAGYMEWACNHISLLSIDESVVVIGDVPVSGDNVAYASAVGDTPGVWLLTTADVVSSVPEFNGGPLMIGPEATRLYYLKDDTGDPSSVSSKLLIEYEPQVRSI